MTFSRSGIEWGGPEGDWYHLYWWNWLPPRLRYLGYSQDWYDGPMSSFGWWFGNIGWRLPWTRHNGQWGWTIRCRNWGKRSEPTPDAIRAGAEGGADYAE